MSEPAQILKVLFESLTCIDAPDDREAFLTYTCRDNPALRTRLERLLALRNEASDFFDIETAPVPTDTPSPDAPADGEGEAQDGMGTRIGRYRLVKRLGEGGCGVVYLAEQQEPVRRRVALKIIRLGMDTERVIARFEMERQALAMMDHPNIARVFDVGATRTGRPFFVMQLVEGKRITDYCNEKQLGIPARLNLFIRICKAIQHAHQKGVIHRDIKPSNILIWENDGEAVPKVIDFGIAKATGGGLNPDASFTDAGQHVGTPAYMSPEQASGSGMDVDTRSDIFSLGSLLYELLTGRPPFEPERLHKAGAEEFRRILIEDDPCEPSEVIYSLDAAALKEVAAQRDCDPQKLAGSIRGDLDWIVMKALEKDRKRRYGTADSFAADVQRHLNDEPVMARPPGRAYLLGKLVKRNRLVVASVAGVAAALVLGLGLAYSSYLSEREARQEQERLRRVAELARAEEAAMREKAHVRENIAQVAMLMSEGKTEEAEAQLRLTPLSTVEPSIEAANVLRSLGGWYAIRGQWPQAAECYLLLTQANRLSSTNQIFSNNDLVSPGPALVENGNIDDYRKFRAWALGRFGEDPTLGAAQQMLQTTLLLPADAEFLRKLQPMGNLLKQSEFDPSKLKPGWDSQFVIWRAWSIALLEYRTGNHEETIRWCTKALEYKNPAACLPAIIHPILALAHHRAGHPGPAREALDQSRKLLQTAFNPELAPTYEPLGRSQGYWWDWLIARILFREAEAAILGPAARQ